MKKTKTLDPFDRLVQEAEEWLEFGKHHKVHEDTMYWATKILITRDKKRQFEQKDRRANQADGSEMICQRCEHEIENLDRANRHATLESV